VNFYISARGLLPAYEKNQIAIVDPVILRRPTCPIRRVGFGICVYVIEGKGFTGLFFPPPSLSSPIFLWKPGEEEVSVIPAAFR